MHSAGETLVIVPFDPAIDATLTTQFRTHYGINEQVALAGPYSGVLDNGGERVRLSRPDESPLDGVSFHLENSDGVFAGNGRSISP